MLHVKSPKLCICGNQQANSTLFTGQLVENHQLCYGSTALLEIQPSPTENPPASMPPTFSKYALKQEVADSIRSYQWELALPGLSQQNYIICAPTGTGKTLVAGLIISEHLQQSENRGRVLFIVNKVPLARQQKGALENMIHGAHIEEVTGEVAQRRKEVLGHLSPTPGEEQERSIPDLGADIIVSTAGCFFNKLKTQQVEMSDVTLIIIDECHHTHKNTDYAKIMEIYLREKRKGNTSKLPQVVGLTASPGAGDGSNPSFTSVLNHLISLCAHMDADGGIKVVTRHMADLDMHTNKPTSTLAVVSGRKENEPLIAVTCEIMSHLEKMLKLNCTHCKWSQQYHGNWIPQKKIEYMRTVTDSTRDVSVSSRDKVSTCDLLRCLSKALAVYMDLTYEDAIEVLEEFNVATGENATLIEKQLAETMHQLKTKLATFPRVENPLLTGLEQILVQQFSKKPDSMAILFVETKKQATGLQRWVQSKPTLSNIHSQVVTGQTRDTGLKMTKAEQEQAIRGFRESKHNLLITTSVLEEGIDVPACNLVVRYQTVSSEIAQVQAKGRARATSSQTFTVISTGSNKKYQELLNDEKLELVEKVLKFFPFGEVLRKNLAKRQEEILNSTTAQEQCAALHREQHSAYEVELMCRKCKTFACNGSDVHTFHSTLQNVVTDPEFRKRISIRDHHSPTEVPHGMSRTHKISCASCGQDWGVMGRWWKDKRTLPVLKCTNFLFQINKQLPQSYKKWSQVPFTISPAS